MRILWVCNIILPSVAKRLSVTASNKEGWLSGISETVKKNKDFELGVAFPVSMDKDGYYENIDGIDYYGFYEDTVNPDIYDKALEDRLKTITDDFKPDIVHIFGTEFPHTRAVCEVMKDSPNRLLVGIQGILDIYKDNYVNGLPENVVKRRTLRDILRHDSITEQIEKFRKRADNEVYALKIAGNVTGRTKFDRDFCLETKPDVKYHFMNETLRSNFYTGVWEYDKCSKNTLFLSQGNYPIKGVHYVFEAVSALKLKYPDIKVRIAGDVITRFDSVKDKIKISSYGKYLREQMTKYNLYGNVEFVGSLDAEAMKKELLNCNIFVCPSTIENSPNSLGEAMLLSVPCVTADVGGITSIFNADADGIVYKGGDVDGLVAGIDKMLSDASFAKECGKSAHRHAALTHNPETNYLRLLEIYADIKESL